MKERKEINEVLLTQGGLEVLEEQIQTLRSRLNELSKYLPDAPAHSPPHQEHYLTSLRLQQLERARRRARIIDNREAAEFGIGQQLRIEDLDTGEKESYLISTPGTSAPEAGIISYLSPLAKAARDVKPGDVIKIETPGGKRRIRIL